MNDRASAGEVDVAPDFVPSDDERLESLATTGRGPLRLAAAAVLAADSRQASRLARRTARLSPPTPAATAAADDAVPAPRPGARSGPAPRRTARPERNVTRARIQRARSNHQGKLLNGPVDPAQKVADERAWQRWESDQPEPDEQNGFERLDEPRRGSGLGRWRKSNEVPQPQLPPASNVAAEGAPKASWRQRANAALDRLAEQEVARGARLEQRVIPQIGRPNRR